MNSSIDALRLRIAALIGDLGACVLHLDSADEVIRGTPKSAGQTGLITEQLDDAKFAADVVVARAMELSEAIEAMKGGAS